jgi:squalene-hopene/tetraprenyl-beta-curcumene cyclase
MRSILALSLAVALVPSAVADGAEPLTLENVAEPAPPSADEPLAREFSLDRAAEAIDMAALHWQKTRKCAACHTMRPSLMARPFLASVSPEPPALRTFFESIVQGKLEAEPALPKDGVSAVVIEVALGLAFHDRATTGKLHPATREELQRMWSLQRDDGGWQWPFRDTPPIKSDEHYGVTLAALAAGIAPEEYAQDPAAQRGLAGIRKFLLAHPPTSLHQRVMLLWAGQYVEGLISESERKLAIADLAAAQRPDGGWSLASLTENSNDPQSQSEPARAARSESGHGETFLVFVGRDKLYRSSLASDGYATGFALYVLRQAGVPADDPGIRRGVAWLKSHQRESGRWFTPSQSWHTAHRLTSGGTAYAILALHACGEIPPSLPRESHP